MRFLVAFVTDAIHAVVCWHTTRALLHCRNSLFAEHEGEKFDSLKFDQEQISTLRFVIVTVLSRSHKNRTVYLVCFVLKKKNDNKSSNKHADLNDI